MESEGILTNTSIHRGVEPGSRRRESEAFQRRSNYRRITQTVKAVTVRGDQANTSLK
jgi:hypothetical protein